MTTVIDTTVIDTGNDDRLRPLAEGDHGLFSVGRRFILAHGVLIDALAAAGLLAVCTVWLALSPFASVATAVLQVALIAPLIWRRSQATAVFVAVAAVALAQWLLGDRLLGDASLLVALYSVAVHESRRRALAAAAMLEVGAVLAATRWNPAGTVPRSFVFLTATVVAALFAGLTVRSGSEYLAWLAERAERLEVERDQQKAIGAAIERARIAREIHDIVAHSLSVVITLADAASVVNESDPEQATAAMHQASDVGRQALRDVRSVMNVLRADDDQSALAPQPDISQLGDLFDRVRATGLDVEVDVVGHEFVVGAATELTVYRILQEALTNSIKHAGATRVQVLVRYACPVLELQVKDNGRGGAAVGHGHGIDGMNERAALHGGTMVAGPDDEGGWSVTVTLRPDLTAVPA
jgi:signal transduction histidine kinase